MKSILAVLAASLLASMAAHAETEEEFIARAVRQSPPLLVRAKVPGGYLQVSQKEPCSIPEVAAAVPSARGGRFVLANRDYLELCAWSDGAGHVLSVDQAGNKRFNDIGEFEAVAAKR